MTTERFAACALTALGVLTVGTGVYFMAIRPALLPEDVRFTGVDTSLLPAQFFEWLLIVFRTWGGFIAAFGILMLAFGAAPEAEPHAKIHVVPMRRTGSRPVPSSSRSEASGANKRRREANTLEPSRRSARSQPARLFSRILAIGSLVVACSSSSGDDGHHEDAGNDASFESATPRDGGVESASDGADGGVSQDASESVCVPSCTSSQACCVDEHGHFPRCADGPMCPPPLQPPGGTG